MSVGSFRKLVVLHDDATGHAAGWDPDGSQTKFLITDNNSTLESLVLITINGGAENSSGDQAFCWADTGTAGPPRINLQCNRGVKENGVLMYLLINP
jgi:hypothetical protein